MQNGEEDSGSSRSAETQGFALEIVYKCITDTLPAIESRRFKPLECLSNRSLHLGWFYESIVKFLHQNILNVCQ